MAYFNVEKRVRADGTPRYRCTVSIKEKGSLTHRESKTFSKLAHARTWGAKRVLELERDGYEVKRPVAPPMTVGELIEKYIATQVAGRSKLDGLKVIRKREVSSVDILKATANDYVKFARDRRAEGVSPATVKNDITNLSQLIKAASPLFGVPANTSAIIEAKDYLTRLKIISSSNKRTRRAEGDEVERILQGLKEKELAAYSKAPFSKIFLFSILTCMRIGEVCSLRWDDVDYQTKSILVRDRKDPRKKEGNHMVVPLLGGAWDILNEQQKQADLIFPFRARNITQVYRAVRDELGISELRYHDLRREGASRLFEMGFSVEEVAQVTGHKNLQTLWTVYREMYPQTLHDRFEQLQRERNSGH